LFAAGRYGAQVPLGNEKSGAKRFSRDWRVSRAGIGYHPPGDWVLKSSSAGGKGVLLPL